MWEAPNVIESFFGKAAELHELCCNIGRQGDRL